MKLDKAYWTERYESGQVGWDVGEATPPIAEYFSQYEHKSAKILVPGAGNAHEAELLHELGFHNVYICDLSSTPLEHFSQRVPSFPSERLLCMDFFDLEGSFDVIVEQTFFCALHPEQRSAYVQKQHQLLADDGILVGVLFGIHFEKEGPPFGGSREEYQSLFTPYFDLEVLEPCTNSIPPRMGSELFIKLRKKPVGHLSGARH